MVVLAVQLVKIRHMVPQVKEICRLVDYAKALAALIGKALYPGNRRTGATHIFNGIADSPAFAVARRFVAKPHAI